MDDLTPLAVGTQAVPKVKGAGPGLFGVEPEPEEAAPLLPAPTAVPLGTSSPTPGPADPAPPLPDPAADPLEAARSALVPPRPASALPPMPPPPPTSPEDAPVPGADVRPVTVLFSPPELAVSVGETATTAVVVVGAQDLEWVELEVVWDGGLAEISEVQPGSLLTLDGAPVAASRTLEAGRARVRFSRPTGASGSGAVAALTFRGLREGSGAVVVESVTVAVAGTIDRPAPPPPGRIVVGP